MKLSMDIIAHWIRQYEPVATIVSNELTIAGIRLFSYDKTPDRDYLYFACETIYRLKIKTQGAEFFK